MTEHRTTDLAQLQGTRGKQARQRVVNPRHGLIDTFSIDLARPLSRRGAARASRVANLREGKDEQSPRHTPYSNKAI